MNMSIKTREDSWDASHDNTLAQTVLNHIRSGSTQLKAFDEAADLLTRTTAACGFRWNSTVRKKYEKEIREAKLSKPHRKAKESALASSEKHVYLTYSTDDNISSSFHTNAANAATDVMTQIINIAKAQIGMFQELAEENARLKREVNDLKRRIESLSTPENSASEDIQAFIKIMERARSLSKIDQ